MAKRSSSLHSMTSFVSQPKVQRARLLGSNQRSRRKKCCTLKFSKAHSLVHMMSEDLQSKNLSLNHTTLHSSHPHQTSHSFVKDTSGPPPQLSALPFFPPPSPLRPNLKQTYHQANTSPSSTPSDHASRHAPSSASDSTPQSPFCKRRTINDSAKRS